MKKIIWSWLPLAVAGSVIFVTIYVVGEQAYRQTANDPQIELVENAGAALSAGFPINALFANATKLDMNNTLSMFVMVFDDAGNLVASSVTNGSSTPPIPPKGVFMDVKAHGQNRVTWQTPQGLRFAAVVDSFHSDKTSGFIMSARSLRETEVRQANLSWVVFLAWIVFLLVSLAAKYIPVIMRPLQGVDIKN